MSPPDPRQVSGAEVRAVVTAMQEVNNNHIPNYAQKGICLSLHEGLQPVLQDAIWKGAEESTSGQGWQSLSCILYV